MKQDVLANGIRSQTIFTGDNLHILRGMDTNCIDLIYLDPPFNSNRDYAAPIGSLAAGAGFKDTWKWNEKIHRYWIDFLKKEHPKVGNLIDMIGAINGPSDQAYLTYMAPRLLHIRRVLKDTGSLYFHCDPTMSHSVKLMLDAIFGGRKKAFRNEIVWCYHGPGSPKMRQFNRKSDTIFWYNKGNTWTFNADTVRIPHKDGSPHSGGFKGAKGNVSIDDPKYAEKGKVPENWWVIAIAARSKTEYVGYPTQKPLKLLRRIILASSNEGDWVLDPFCGCATTCLVAHELGRRWIGIDVGAKAHDLIKMRFTKELPLLTHKTIHRTDLPLQSSIFVPNKKDMKELLYGKQHGNCNGCHEHFNHPRHFHVDHIVPKSKGGQDDISNSQLLCGSCNVIKGDKDMSYLINRLKELGIIDS